MSLTDPPRTFKRVLEPRGGQGVFVVGPYSGQLSARGETLILEDDLGRAVSTFGYPGAPGPVQEFLRISELHFHPLTPADATYPDEDYEFIELLNRSDSVTLDLRGVRITGAVEFVFGGAPLSTVVPGGRVLVVANPAAFESHHGSGLPVAGSYQGRLDNGEERIRLLDPVGEEILDFRYADWFPESDGGGSSIEIVNIGVEPDSWGDKAQWTRSSTRDGTPGSSSTGTLTAHRGQGFEVFLSFVATANLQHLLQVTDSLVRPEWKTVLTVPASATSRSIEHIDSTGSSTRFSRVLTSP